MSTALWTVLVVAVWLLIALPFAVLLGRATRRNTEEPEDWVRAEDMPDWDWPAKPDEREAA